MRRAAAGLVTLAIFTSACGSTSAPTSPSVAAVAAGNAGPADGSSLKAGAPTPLSPINDQLIGASKTNGPTLSASAVSGTYTSAPMQYRFRVMDANGVISQFSGLVTSPSWLVPVVLSPNQRYTWNVRAEYQGLVGPWSVSGSFLTPDVPPAYSRFIGNWQGCANIPKKLDLVGCVYNAVLPNDSVSDMEYVKRVAWLLRSEGAGLLIKTGESSIIWQGYSLSISRICYPDGHIYKIVVDAGPGGANTATFDDNGFVDPKLYVAAIDPAKP